MRVSMDCPNARAVIKDLKTYQGETRERVSRAIRLATNATRRFARANVRSHTGNLKRGIKAAYDGRALAGVVRSTAPHAHLVEFGTKGKGIVKPRRAKAFRLPNGFIMKSFVHKGMKPRPYLRPAVKRATPKFEKDLLKAVEDQ